MKRIKSSSIRDSSPQKSSFLPIIAILRLSPLFPVLPRKYSFHLLTLFPFSNPQWDPLQMKRQRSSLRSSQNSMSRLFVLQTLSIIVLEIMLTNCWIVQMTLTASASTRIVSITSGILSYAKNCWWVLLSSEQLLKVAGNIERGKIVSIGTKFGKFNHNLKFRLHITCLDILAQYALVYHFGLSVLFWSVEQGLDQGFCGNDIFVWKSHHKGRYARLDGFWRSPGLARITEDTDQYAGVIVYNMNNVPLGIINITNLNSNWIGFGIATHTTEQIKALDAAVWTALLFV